MTCGSWTKVTKDPVCSVMAWLRCDRCVSLDDHHKVSSTRTNTVCLNNKASQKCKDVEQLHVGMTKKHLMTTPDAS